MQPQQTIIITGGNAGLGYQTAKQLAHTKAWHIILAVRDPQRSAEAVTKLQQETNWPHIEAMTLDLASLASVRDFVTAYAVRHDLPSLTGIICNAGLSVIHEYRSADGYELTFATNHLGHFLLVNLLLKFLTSPARIVFISSGTHIPGHLLSRFMGVPIARYTSARALALPDEAPPKLRIRNPYQRYPTSKLCNVLCAYELSRRLLDEGCSTPERPINVYAIDPGLMPGTGLFRDAPRWLVPVLTRFISTIEPFVSGIRKPERSAQDVVRLVTDETLSGLPTGYFDGQQLTRSSKASYDLSLARDLWETSVELASLKQSETPLRI